MIGRRTVLGAIATCLTGLAFAAEPFTDPPLVVLSLRGGWDALSLLVPLDGPDRAVYEQARPSLRLPVRRCRRVNDLFGLHPEAGPLHEMLQSGELGLVMAAGLTADTRSHFEAITRMERGDPTAGDGWLGRYLGAAQSAFPAVALGAPNSALLGTRALTLSSLEELRPPSHAATLEHWYADSSWLGQAGRSALQASRWIERAHLGRPGPGYPSSDFGQALQEAARIVKAGLGVRVLTLELEGWDTHEGQERLFAARLKELGQGLLAFRRDMGAHRFRLVALSEFGRRLAENASGGTDHGHGGAMLVMGSDVRGGLLGSWPGLAEESLYQHEDLAVTCDFRQVLSEMLSSCPAGVFPGFQAGNPLGLLRQA